MMQNLENLSDEITDIFKKLDSQTIISDEEIEKIVLSLLIKEESHD